MVSLSERFAKAKEEKQKGRPNYTPRSEDEKFQRRLFKESVKKHNATKARIEKNDLKRLKDSDSRRFKSDYYH